MIQNLVLQFMSLNPNCNIVAENHQDYSAGIKPLVSLKGKLWI